LRKAYDICEAIQTDEAAFSKKLEDENGDDPTTQAQKIMVLKTACNGLFCNEQHDPYAAENIGQAPICFKAIKPVDLNQRKETETTPPNA